MILGKLEEKMASFEEMRKGLLDELSSLPDEVLKTRPLEDKWSILEIVEHMAVAEREVLLGLPEYSEIRGFRRTFKNKLMLKVVMFVLGNRIRVKVPSKTMNPKGELSLADVRAAWDESQEWFRNYVAACDEEALRKAVFKHPVSGPIEPLQAVDMSIAHFKSHKAQIDRLLELSQAKQ
ncbi:MAG: DinB family protein [Acidobacteriota bacterium]|nr:MAG: DinB family protein [Acidobacteriota bacterium]